MKKTILRILISAAVLSLVSDIAVLIIGLVLKWKTSAQFSDGFFWAGAILISCGFLSVLGRLNQPVVPYSQSGLYLNGVERARQWAADLSQGYNIMAFLAISGLLTLGVSGLCILIGNLF